MGLGTHSAVVVILDGHFGQGVFVDAVGVEVAVRSHGEQRGGRGAVADHRMVAEGPEPALAGVTEFLEAEGQDHVVHPRSHGHTGIAEGIHARGAVVLNAGSRNPAHVEGLRHRRAAETGRGKVNAGPYRLDLLSRDGGVGQRLVGGLDEEVAGSASPVLAETRAANSHHRHAIS